MAAANRSDNPTAAEPRSFTKPDARVVLEADAIAELLDRRVEKLDDHDEHDGKDQRQPLPRLARHQESERHRDRPGRTAPGGTLPRCAPWRGARSSC